jgi:hypothetical protein
VDNHNEVPRSVHLADFLVVLTGFLHNLSNSFTVFTEELMELSIYHATRKSKVSRVWEEFSNDLEKIQEDTDGA